MSLTLNKSILELQSIQNEIEKERIELKQVKKDAKYAKSLKLEISSLENHKTLFEIQLQEKEEYLKIIEEDIELEQTQIKELKIELNLKDRKLSLKEKRLEKLEQKLFSKK
tara:strand:- start:1371 stop:1703 length:333 start_codon:yes stop_codon:yes gene_type:complete